MPQLNGLFYTEYSKAETQTPVVLIHGAASNHLIWSKDLRHVANRRVMALDLPAHGRSEGTASQSVRGYAEAVIQLLDDRNIPEAIFLGHSMGGAIAQTLALEFSARCQGLILVATGAKLPVNNTILTLTRENYPEAAALINKWSWSPEAPAELKQTALEQMLSVPAEVVYADYVACNTFDVSERLSHIEVPVLLIYGTQDKMTPLTWGEFLAEQLPRATLKTIEGAGHMVILEHPTPLSEHIVQWLGEQNL